MSELFWWLLNHTRACTRTLLSNYPPVFVLLDLQVCSVGKRTTGTLKDLHALSFTCSHTHVHGSRLLVCRTELVPVNLMTTPQAFHSFCSVQPALFVPQKSVCLPHLQTSINSPICCGNSHNTGEPASSWLTGWNLKYFGEKRARNVCLLACMLLLLFFFCHILSTSVVFAPNPSGQWCNARLQLVNDRPAVAVRHRESHCFPELLIQFLKSALLSVLWFFRCT